MDLCSIPGVASVCDAAATAAAGTVESLLMGLTAAVSTGAADLMRGMWAAFETTTFVDLTTDGFTRVYNIVFGVAVFVMLAFFLLQLITGMLHREPAAMTRAALGLGKSILGSFVVVTVIAAGLEITDRVATAMIDAAGTTLTEVGDRITLLTTGTALTAASGPGGAILVVLLLSSVTLCAGLILWLSLLIRKALLLVAIAFAPVALAGATWDSTRGWVGRWANVVIALIVSKIVVVVFLLLATAQITAPVSADLTSLSDPLSGIVLLLVAGFAPYMTYKAITFMGFDMYHAMSAEQEAKQALNRPVPVPARFLNRAETPRILGTPGATADGGPTPTPRPAPSSPGVPTGHAAAHAATTGASAAPASGGTSAAAAGGGAAAAGSAGPIVAGAMAAKAAADAGPRAGAWVAGQSTRGADAAQDGAHR
ncbi:conjugal transfer protein TrbL [Xylanimonas allomyrinae]|uniref:Conjugal transfer protein TrbL n=1 Tax=Xylanimonas allomyrinae TaxID=2509459 RepID=A0A4P6ELT8_9MICO|nr:conjugal transfer protein TrbL [Xylanimonas allomyrinae]QAY63236.1 conjugal transfer protein TrbL [Xylanimonas allomyrinae]